MLLLISLRTSWADRHQKRGPGWPPLSPSPYAGAALSRREPLPVCWSERGSPCAKANERASSRQVEARERCVYFPAKLLPHSAIQRQPKQLREAHRSAWSSHSLATGSPFAQVSPSPARPSRVLMTWSGDPADLKTALTSLERGSGTA